MRRRDRPRSRRTYLLALMALVGGFAVAPSPSSADVTAVMGSAYGYSANFTIFGGGPFIFEPTPTVVLPPEGYSIPVQNSVPSGRVAQGPGVLFTSGPISVTAFGTTGPAGEVQMSSTIENVPTSTVGEILYAGSIHSSCEASEAGVSGSTTLAGPGDAGHAAPTLRISDGNPDVEGDETYVDLPLNPPPNHTIEGNLESVGDTFRVVFNEQILNPDGSLTVNAVHEYLIGPTAVGDLILGHVVCGVTATGVTTTTVDPGVTTTTVDPGVTTTTVDPGVTTTTVDPGVTTTTVDPGVTTTTVDPGVTTTTVDPGVTTTTVDPGVTTTTVGGGGGGGGVTTTTGGGGGGGGSGGGGQTAPTIRVGAPLSRTGSESDLMIAWAALALTLGGLFVMGAKCLPDQDGSPPEPEQPHKPPPPD